MRPRVLPGCGWILVLLPGVVLSGCLVSPLEKDVSYESVGEAVVEFYHPAGQQSPRSQFLESMLAQAQLDELVMVIPPVDGILESQKEFLTFEAELHASLEELEIESLSGAMRLTLELDVSDPVLALQILENDQVVGDCSLHVSVPPQFVNVTLIMGEGQYGEPLVTIAADPIWNGEAIDTALDPYCQDLPEAVIHLAVSEAVELALHGGFDVLLEGLTGATGQFLGLETSAEGTFQNAEVVQADPGRVHFHMAPGDLSATLGMDGAWVGLDGGFESNRAACVPASAEDIPASLVPPAEFPETVPGTGESYLSAMSVSDDFLMQGLLAVYRGGLFCRRAGAGDLEEIDLVSLYPSLESLGTPDSVRVALWPGQSPEIEFEPANTDHGEVLPRVLVTLPGFSVELYGRVEGADLLVIGMTADLTLELVPELVGEVLSLELAQTRVSGLAIDSSELLMESAAVLRPASSGVLESVAGKIVEAVGPVPVPLPAGARGSLLGAEHREGRTILYFGP